MRSRTFAFLGLWILAAGLSAVADDEYRVADDEYRVELEHAESRRLVDFVTRAAALFAERGPEACAEFKRRDGEWRRGDAYVFVIDTEGEAVCHPAKPDLEGRNLLEIRDPDGKPVVQLFLRQLVRGSGAGWVHYLWPRPGETVLGWKSTFVRRASVAGNDYIVGSGAYDLEMERAFVVDRVEEAVEILAADGRSAFDVLRDKAGGFLFLDAYVFVMDAGGVMRVNPAFPEMEGQPALDIEDQEGVSPGREMLKLLENRDQGWVSYYWPRPAGSRGKAAKKETFVKKVTVGDDLLVVGAGVYLD